MLEPVFQWDARRRQNAGYAFLRDEVFPRRMAMLEIAGRIAHLNEEQLNRGEGRASQLLGRFQTRLGATLLAALCLGALMAAYSTREILRLEAQANARYQQAADARQQLTSLSARLVSAQENERRSLSRELHDEVGQSLFAVALELHKILANLGAAPPGEMRMQLERLKTMVEGTVGEVRNMALLLRPSMLDDLGLVPALKWQAREVRKQTSMDVSVETELVSDTLPDDYKTCIYRIVQEALHNCARHSQARTVRIGVRQDTARLLVSVEDDGKGFDVNHTKGLGLLGIEERTTQLGGRCWIDSKPGAGTRLNVELPLQAPAGKA